MFAWLTHCATDRRTRPIAQWCPVFAVVALSIAAIAGPAGAGESLTTIGTPDCHVQGRLLRIAHHCPPAAVAAAPAFPAAPYPRDAAPYRHRHRHGR